MSFRPYEVKGHFAAPPQGSVGFDKTSYSARPGEPLIATLHAHGVRVVGRSGKYHRPRGLSCGRGACGTCVARVNGLPNQRLCTHVVEGGEISQAQNVLGSASLDLLAPIDWIFKDGLDHHHLMTHSVTLNRAAVTMARKIAGLGTLPDAPTPSVPPYRTLAHDVVVVGGGDAGRGVAQVTRAQGYSTLVLDALAADADVVQATVLGLYDDTELVAVHGLQQLRITARAIVLANGTYEQAPTCVGNDLPGVLLLGAAELLLRHGIVPGWRVVVAVHPHVTPDLRARAHALVEQIANAGAQVIATVGLVQNKHAHHSFDGEIVAIEAHQNALRVRAPDAHQGVNGDALIYIAQPTPAFELPRQMGLATPFDATKSAFVPQANPDGTTTRQNVFLAGEVCGWSRPDASAHGITVGNTVVRYLASQS